MPHTIVFFCVPMFLPLIPPAPFSQRQSSWEKCAVVRIPARFCPPDTLPFLAVFCIPVRFCPLIPPAPFSHKGRRGSLGVLMPETEDGTQGLPQQPSPVSLPPHSFSHKGRRGTLGVLIPFFPHSPARLSCTQGREIGRPDEPKRGCVRSHVQTAGRPSCSTRRCASRFPSGSHD